MENYPTLFDMTTIMPSLDELIASATKSLRAVMEQRIPLVALYSGGKDSTTVVDLLLATAKQYVAETGLRPIVVMLSADTLMENPEVHAHVRQDLRKMAAFAKANGFRAITKIAQPSLLSTFQLKILTGRGLPSFPGGNSDCSTDLKITASLRARAELFVELEKAGYPEPVMLLGTRFDESVRRELHMKARQENAFEPVRNKQGELILSPICNWSTDDVFEYLGTREKDQSYSTFEDTLRIYAHSEGTSCSVVAAAIEEGATRKRGGCGTRTGCWGCQMAVDKSLENMIAFDERYRYAAPLNKINKFIRNTRWDWTRRHWIGRTIKAGYVAIQPDSYHPNMVRELFRYMYQAQYDERMRAAHAREAPKFTIFSDKMLLAIDAFWSLTGLARPFTVWADVHAIESGEVRYDVPEVEPVKETPIPDARFLYVGNDWEDGVPAAQQWGLRDVYLESLLETSACAPSLKITASGREIWDMDCQSTFDVHEESIAMIEDFEMDRLLDIHRNDSLSHLPGSITYGYKWYLQFGALQLSATQAAKHDEMLRRTAHKDSLGLTCEYDINDLLARSVRFAEMPADARKAWSRKATTDSTQQELVLA